MFSHIDDQNHPRMVDVGAKQPTRRTARARTLVELPEAVRALFKDGELHSKKGPVFQTAIVAGIMAAKKTSELIPMCHPLPIENCSVDIRLDGDGNAVIDCEVAVHHKTGVEMEALTGASVAALTLYDMCKGISHDMVIRETRLLEKRGGKSDYAAQR